MNATISAWCAVSVNVRCDEKESTEKVWDVWNPGAFELHCLDWNHQGPVPAPRLVPEGGGIQFRRRMVLYTGLSMGDIVNNMYRIPNYQQMGDRYY